MELYTTNSIGPEHKRIFQRHSVGGRLDLVWWWRSVGPVNMEHPSRQRFRSGSYGRNGHVQNQNWIASWTLEPFFFFLKCLASETDTFLRHAGGRAVCVSSASGSELETWNLPASGHVNIFSFLERTRFRSACGKRDLSQKYFSCPGSPA